MKLVIVRPFASISLALRYSDLLSVQSANCIGIRDEKRKKNAFSEEQFTRAIVMQKGK